MPSFCLEFLRGIDEGIGIVAGIDAVAGACELESRSPDGASCLEGTCTGWEQLWIKQFPHASDGKRNIRDCTINGKRLMAQLLRSSIMKQEILPEEFRRLVERCHDQETIS
jgi:hypothetical protein